MRWRTFSTRTSVVGIPNFHPDAVSPAYNAIPSRLRSHSLRSPLSAPSRARISVFPEYFWVFRCLKRILTSDELFFKVLTPNRAVNENSSNSSRFPRIWSSLGSRFVHGSPRSSRVNFVCGEPQLLGAWIIQLNYSRQEHSVRNVRCLSKKTWTRGLTSILYSQFSIWFTILETDSCSPPADVLTFVSDRSILTFGCTDQSSQIQVVNTTNDFNSIHRST
ncbi:hypothetical protein KQX54_019747 [Cotesia glomerata]|uniref:Uncharacterized protein n=1 Tax=Cotesia glomerata TaxID=32391 RepID=A0AAV7IJV4_COTGL|nr:hypothetical protein KQX54_019747 [Cotesia glomerata]